MSVNDLPPSADPTISNTSQPYASDLEALDNRLKRLSEDVLPQYPYLLTLPTNAPFRLQSRSANNWAVGHDRPFTSEEQQLQYMTFLTHHDGDSLLVAVGDWSDESGRMVTDRTRTAATATATATESPRDSAATKKKISLKDYNTQKVTSTSTSTSTPTDNHIRDRPSTSKREGATARATTPDHHSNSNSTSNSHAHSNDKLESKTTPTKTQSKLSPTKDKETKKRPSASYTYTHNNQQISKGPEMHSPKKSRLSPEKDQRVENSQPRPRSPRLPALLSPTLPPTTGPRLPRLLSPTLPPDIEKELAKIAGHSPAQTSPKRESAPVRIKRNDELQTRTPTSMNSVSNSSHQGGHGHGHGHTVTSSKDTIAQNLPRRIVCLKYGKSNRKRVEALLKFSVKKKAYPTNSTPGVDTDADDVSHAERRREDVSHSRNNNISSQQKSKSKGSGTRHEADETYGGRVRGEPKAYADKPTTPAFHPPVHERHKPNSLTPAKDIKGLSSRSHGDHGDGDGNGKTPINPANKRYSTDLGLAKGSPSQPSDNRSRDSDRRAWREEFQKFSSIGRDLKHASERYIAVADPSPADEKLSAVTAIEAILSFILAFVADNQCKSLARQVGDSSSWCSILAYWRVVKKKSVSYPALYGLSLILGAVSYDAIHALDLERLAASPLPGEQTPAPTPGGDSNTHHMTTPSDEHRKIWEKFSELKTRLPECYRESQKLWLEGSRTLSEDVLRHDFPTSWSRRSHNYAERGRIPLKAGDYAGDYFLPLGGTTQPIEIVRFTWSILHEWCERENIDWNERLVL